MSADPGPTREFAVVEIGEALLTVDALRARNAQLAAALRPFALCVGDDDVVRGTALRVDYLVARDALKCDEVTPGLVRCSICGEVNRRGPGFTEAHGAAAHRLHDRFEQLERRVARLEADHGKAR